MKEAIVDKGPSVEIINSDIPKPNADQVLIKVIVSGSNPKDWKIPVWSGRKHNSGDDIAGYVEEVGENVVEFKKGDRVAAFHEMTKPHGSFAEYAIAWAHTTFHLPKKTSFEEGATIPLAAMTAALGLFQELGLPTPLRPATSKIPLIIYGGSSAVGAFAIKLAQAANIHPLLVVAGRAQDFVGGLIDKSKGDTIIDYRKGDEAVVTGFKEALKANGFEDVKHAYDAISEKGSFKNILPVLSKSGATLRFVLPDEEHKTIPSYVDHKFTSVGSVHSGPTDEQKAAGLKTSNNDFGFAYFRLFARGLQEGWFSGHPYEVVPGGLNGVEKGLKDLQNGVNSATKYVFKIEETK